jgi:cytochrome c
MRSPVFTLWLFALFMAGIFSRSQGGEAGKTARLEKTTLAANLFEPMQLSIAADGRVFFGERHGAIKVWRPGSKDAATVGTLNVFTGPEDGLLGLALDPGFITNGWLFVFHSAVGEPDNRVSRFTLKDGLLDLKSEKILLRIPTLPKKPNHSGGGLAFDRHGNLYASTGDYTFINDSNGFSPLDRRPGRDIFDSERTAANSNDPRGKILRIHPLDDGTYSIPEGNLFPPGTPRTLPEIYIMGCRNPFRFSLDGKRDWLFWGDVGPDAIEPDPKRGPAGFDEFNVAVKAGNFGWPYFAANNKPYVEYDFATQQSGQSFDPNKPVNHSPNNTGITELPPAQGALIWYPPGPSSLFPELGSGARSAMAGPVYYFDASLKSDRKLPQEFDQALFIYDWERSWIKTAQLDARAQLKAIKPFAPEIKLKRPISMAIGPDGALYILEWGSAWYNNKDSALVRIEQGN